MKFERERQPIEQNPWLKKNLEAYAAEKHSALKGVFKEKTIANIVKIMEIDSLDTLKGIAYDADQRAIFENEHGFKMIQVEHNSLQDLCAEQETTSVLYTSSEEIKKKDLNDLKGRVATRISLMDAAEALEFKPAYEHDKDFQQVARFLYTVFGKTGLL